MYRRKKQLDAYSSVSSDKEQNLKDCQGIGIFYKGCLISLYNPHRFLSISQTATSALRNLKSGFFSKEKNNFIAELNQKYC